MAERRLVVCCDGTWNDPGNEDEGELAPTNVVRLRNALVNDPEVQEVHYQPGVGTEGPNDKVFGGAFGVGLAEDIRECYQWLATKYRAGDAVCLFGFSRGAFTARCVAAIVCRFGVLDVTRLEGLTVEAVVKRIYTKGYRNKENDLGLAFPLSVGQRRVRGRLGHGGCVRDPGRQGIPEPVRCREPIPVPRCFTQRQGGVCPARGRRRRNARQLLADAVEGRAR